MAEEGQQQQQQAPWHQGLEPEVLGHIENRGLKLDDPKLIVDNLAKAHREATAKLGVPADQILKLPKELSDEAAMKPIYNRLGVPNEPKDYDLSSVKLGGKDLDPGLADTLRAALLKGAVPKDKAGAVASDIAKHLETQDAAKIKQAADDKAVQVNALKKNWGTDTQFKINEGLALQGATKMGLSQEQYNKITDAVGIDVAAELFRKIGAGTAEDTFVENGGGGAATTVQGAQARLAELQANPEWAAKLISKTGGAAEKAEFAKLMALVAAAS